MKLRPWWVPTILGTVAVLGCASEQERACAHLLAAANAKDSTPAGVVSRRTFYSKKLETCVLVQESRTGVEMFVDDLSDDFLQTMKLFFCDRNGIDAAILDSVRKYHGRVWTVSYSHWLDDGSGGPPRTMKTPTQPLSKAACKAALMKFLTKIE